MASFNPSLSSLEGCHSFINNASPDQIAQQILRDQQLCREGGIPSLLVHCLPRHTDRIARAISASPAIPIPVARMRLASIISIIKTHLATLGASASFNDIPEHLVPTDADYDAALKVFRYLQLPQVAICPDPSTPLSTVINILQAQLRQDPHFRDSLDQHSDRKRYCYNCRFAANYMHKLYPGLCNPCGEFNISSSSLSLPSNLVLNDKLALITGGRINLGYHTALRLLRCGTKVIGADFRSARDVFALVKAVLTCLEEWCPGGPPKLDILINNAAQTLTDSVEKEGENIEREHSLGGVLTDPLLLNAGYAPRVRGGVVGYQIDSKTPKPQVSLRKEGDELSALITSKNAQSSWVQGISEIPYEDVISAHSVNTFVPFILLRELLPYMGPRPQQFSDPLAATTARTPCGYVVNISSREGLFERKPDSGAKGGHHVHTNMTKAALNMLTETEASAAWKNGRVAINTVDPGFMSADPEFMKMIGREGQSLPIGWEDGAGRVLWPIAKGEQGQIIRGRFLKHFTVVEAPVR